MTCSRVEQAARNNAVWCETICRVHGTPGEFHDTLWLNRHPVPRFYPNVVTTLATQTGMAAQLADIQARSWRSACLAGVVSRTASARWIWRRLASSPCLTPPGCGVHRASPSQPGGFRAPLDLRPKRVRAGTVGNSLERQPSEQSIFRAPASLSASTARRSGACLHSLSLRRSASPCCTRCGSGPGRQNMDTAQPGLAPDCLQPSLLRPCGFRQQVKPGVRRTKRGIHRSGGRPKQ